MAVIDLDKHDHGNGDGCADAYGSTNYFAPTWTDLASAPWATGRRGGACAKENGE
jgi:hypothetical protein